MRNARVREAPKKVSAVAFSGDGRAALFADKFGDVLAAAAPDPGPAPGQNPAGAGAAPMPALAEPATNGHSAPVPAAASPPAPASTQAAAAAAPSDAAPAAGERVKPALLLGHFCSTVTALAVAHGAARLASADRDGKIRVSVLPRAPLLVRLPAAVAALRGICKLEASRSWTGWLLSLHFGDMLDASHMPCRSLAVRVLCLV